MITRHGARSLSALLVAVAAAVGLSACASPSSVQVVPAAGVAGHATAPTRQVAGAAAAAAADAAVSRAAAALRPPTIDLGKGLVSFPGETQAWVAAHSSDPRTPLISKRIASQPSNLWLTGDESFDNLRRDVALARRSDRTMLLTIYNIPGRDDGLSAPSAVSLTRYKTWITQVARIIGTTRAVIVVEPDALWFYDRLPSTAARSTRLAAVSYAIGQLHHVATRSRLYLEAGTSSGSVTPTRMAALLLRVGVAGIAGYAVNVSSYAPTAAITKYAQGIRTALLRSKKVANPRYVIDTGRNGASSWDNTWCNPTTQRLGVAPRLVRSTTGLDLDLWVKAPGTSDGSCGPVGAGAGTYGGQFLPNVAYAMITG